MSAVADFDLSEVLPSEHEGQGDEPVGAWQTFEIETDMGGIGSGGVTFRTLQQMFPVRCALYAMQGAARSDDGTGLGQQVFGGLDGFLIQVQMFDQQFINAGGVNFVDPATNLPTRFSPLIAMAFFDRATGIKRFRKPWIIGANEPLTIFVASATTSNVDSLYLSFTVLLLDIPSDSVVQS
jgi:hypothetical protein